MTKDKEKMQKNKNNPIAFALLLEATFSGNSLYEASPFFDDFCLRGDILPIAKKEIANGRERQQAGPRGRRSQGGRA
ncbi:MAG TPA: hypothetical protein IAC52_02865 [Candidatus Enteromonas pullicola]|uniref:Uncharacterized protein n=1 Tax=Candidatus Alloenteromonas pullicola TaxID=2840784 RepID=A0A9D1LNS6_9FIRM|nr:hypothetical protein [Candidatus Enteromonas pullicola]